MQELSVYYNLQAEQCLIGLALQNADVVKLLADVNVDTFYDTRHKIIHSGICALAKEKKPVDLITMDGWLTQNSLAESVGGTGYLIECTNVGFLGSEARHYLLMIQECAMRRTLYTIGKELMAKSGTETPDEVRDWAARTIKDVRMGNAVQLITMQEACMTTYEQLEEDQQKPDEPSKKILSGISTLDNKLGGLRGGEYVAIGARPSVGKSILALTFCINAAKQGKRVLLVSLEMNEVQITERVLADQGNVPLNVITSGNLDDHSWSSLAKAISPVSQLPLWYSLDASTVEKIRRAAYQLYENGGLDMIAVDYLQLMEATYAKRQSRQEQIGEISRGLRQLAAELKIPILVLTQLNRSSVSDKVDGKKVRREPTISEARESGAIEQDANIFILLHNPERDEMQSNAERETWDNLDDQGMSMMRLIVGKNRQGKKGRLTVAFDGDHMRFLPIVRKE